ncbi:MAG: hypothetical protein WCF50_18300, partial [Pseudolabrys sp.]
MSALPPKADMCSATRYVRFVPIAAVCGYFGRLIFYPLKNFFAYGRIVLRHSQNLIVFLDR